MGERFWTILIFGCALATGCAKNDGTCKVSDTEAVNTYTPIGKWKKIGGYAISKTEEELELNYEQLFIEPGTKACLTEIRNRASFQSIFNGTYTNSVSSKKLTLPDNTQPTYSFTGQCNDTEMTLSYSNGASEVFQLLDPNIGVGDCGGE